MGRSRFIGFSGRRRGIGHAVFVFVVLALAWSGCGSGGHGAETDSEKDSDVEFLNSALGQELTTLDAYTRGLPRLSGPLAPVGRRLLAQEQEYVNALTKAIRGLGGDTEAEAEEVDLTEVRSGADILTLIYGLESASLASYVDASTRLYSDAPLTLATSLAAGHAQHLVVLRQGLGVPMADAVPEAFDGGVVPPPDIEPDPVGTKPGLR